MHIYTSNSASQKVPRQEFIYRTSPTLVINSQDRNRQYSSCMYTDWRYFHTLVVVDFQGGGDFQTRTNFPAAQPALFSHGREIFPRSNLRSPMFTATVSPNQKIYQPMAITIKHYSVLICITVYSK